MNLRVLTVIAVAGFGLAACDDNEQRGNTPTTTELAIAEIRDNTRDTSEPILLNDLDISDRDTSDTGAPQAI